MDDFECLQLTHYIFYLARAYESRLISEASLKEAHLSVLDVAVLMVIGHNAPLTSRKLAAILGLTPATTSIYVQRLVEKNILEKEQDQDDRRNWWLKLSSQGLVTYQNIVNMTIRYTRDFVSTMDNTEQMTLFGLLQKACGQLPDVNPPIPGKDRLY